MGRNGSHSFPSKRRKSEDGRDAPPGIIAYWFSCHSCPVTEYEINSNRNPDLSTSLEPVAQNHFPCFDKPVLSRRSPSTSSGRTAVEELRTNGKSR
jgi:hypothetical protein